MATNLTKPDYLFEVSWEVCNKVGGIHTVVSTKAVSLIKEYADNYILIGPDLIRNEGENPEFEEDQELFADWIHVARQSGLYVKAGRWKIQDKPIALLVDFSHSFSDKDAIFSGLWESYKLDSLSGQWDYVEPTLFGFTVGRVIESFIRHYLSTDDKVVAQFHEWMTGSGLLYLKNHLPQVATAFTTHATTVGRSIAGNNRPLYNQLEKYVAEEVAKEYGITSKLSLERIAAQEADVFTTVSEITAKECKHFLNKEVDIVTPNGFEDEIIPSSAVYQDKRDTARERMLKVASTLMGQDLPKNTYIVATSGRYEYKNKGIDLFIDAVKKIQDEQKLDKPLLAMLLIPAHHYGARKDLINALNKGEKCVKDSRVLTHNLHDVQWDPIMQQLNRLGIENKPKDKLKVIFVPSYLNGNDGIFDMPYYDLLMGCDQTVFASYYEPWGYTPMESLAFSVPTVTTTLAGFGLWTQKECPQECDAISVITRDDTNDSEAVKEIAQAVHKFYVMQREESDKMRKNAYKISQTALWRALVFYYRQAYSVALQNASNRSEEFVDIQSMTVETHYEHIRPLSNKATWKQITVKPNMPKELVKLTELAANIWWVWDNDAQELFAAIDPDNWAIYDYNPYIVFENIPYNRLEELAKDKDYVEKLSSTHARFKAYMDGVKEMSKPEIAYFSMEFGFHDHVKLYSGGLGILAGDYLKEASDAKINLVGVGLLYRYGYFNQIITLHGEQKDHYDYLHFSKMPYKLHKNEDGTEKTIQLNLPGRKLYARIFELNVGRIKLFLMDTDFEKNRPEDREITHKLYGGNNENRLKQELLLGFGGIRMLEELGYKPDLYHSNEGHSAFIGLERVRLLMQRQQISFAEAVEIVRASTLFTTHTPVPAGHDHFEEEQMRIYLGQYPQTINLSWEKFMALGRGNPNDWHEKFNMSYLAAHMAQETNGVSMLHGEVTRDMFAHLWPGYLPEELYVGHVTNGVHWPTWTAKEWKPVYEEMFDNNFVEDQLDFDKWKKIYDVPDEKVWSIKETLRGKLIKAVKDRFKDNWIKRHEDPKHIMAINNALSEKTLTIVFARRFATYKRAHLLFRDINRLSKIVNNPLYPMQFIFAGKAHPHDKAGQDLIKMIVEISKRPEFLGKILFLQNYSIELAKLLVSGADIWLNTPTRPLEASGTSGEKAVMNGTLHFSVLDGWWVEGYQPEAGYALTAERTYENQHYQDDLDAEIIYSIFEDEVQPTFYKRGKGGVPTEWVKYIKNTIANVSPKFTTRRMITDYMNRYYKPLYERSQIITPNEYEKTKEIASWKSLINHVWDNIDVLDVKMYEKNTDAIEAGLGYKGHVILDLKDILAEQIGVEIVITENHKELILREEFKVAKVENKKAIYQIDVTIDRPGTFQYGIRVFPKHELMPHRQDFAHLRWI